MGLAVKIKGEVEMTDMVMKIGDLPDNFDLKGCRLKGGLIIYSGWNKGFWCKKKDTDSEVIPVFFKGWDAARELTVVVPPDKQLQLMGSKK
jgi:hypothetical protein